MNKLKFPSWGTSFVCDQAINNSAKSIQQNFSSQANLILSPMLFAKREKIKSGIGEKPSPSIKNK